MSCAVFASVMVMASGIGRPLVLIGLLALVGCGKPASEAKAPPPPEVGVMTLKPQEAVVSTVLPGRVVAHQVSEVRPQVTGILQRRVFTEGARSRKASCSTRSIRYNTRLRSKARKQPC